MATKNFAARRNHCPSFSPLGSDLAAIDIERHLQRFGRVKRFEAASVLSGNGKRSFFLGVIVDGVVAIRRLGRDGNNRILQILGPNDIVYPTVSRHPDIEFETLTPATVRCIDPAQLTAALRNDPELANAILNAATSQLQCCLHQIACMSERPIDRLGFFLLRAIYRPFDPDRTVVSIKRNPIAVVTINRTALAAHIGITTTSLAHLLLALQEEGVIRALTPRRFEILEEARLAASCKRLRAREHLTTSL